MTFAGKLSMRHLPGEDGRDFRVKGNHMKYLLASMLVAACAIPLGADVLERILVKVNGGIISQTDFENRQVAYLRDRNTAFNPEDLKTDAGLLKIVREITPDLIVAAVDEMLLIQLARELGFEMGDEQFNEVIKNIREQSNIDTDLQFEAALRQEGLTRATLRDVLERQYLQNAVLQVEILNKITVTGSEAQEYYETHLEEFTEPAAVTLREILVRAPSAEAGAPGGPRDVALAEEAREKAEAAHARILLGEDFATVAAEASDAPSKANGGLIGPVIRDELAVSVLQLLEGLRVGEVSEVASTPQGYQFFKLESATEATPRPFEQVRDSIADGVFGERQVAAYDALVDRLRREATIEWKDEGLQQAYEQRLAELRSGI